MKAFVPFNKKYQFYHLDDMNKIITFLEATGTINIEYTFLEDLYYEYSDSVCCSWRIVDDESLKEFAAFLSEIDCEPVTISYRRK